MRGKVTIGDNKHKKRLPIAIFFAHEHDQEEVIDGDEMHVNGNKI